MPGWLAAWSGLGMEFRFATGPVIYFAHDGVPDPGATGPPRAPVHLGFRPYALGANLGITRGAFEQVGGFPEDWRTAEDVHMSWRIQLSGTELAYLPEARVAKRRAGRPGVMLRQYYSYGLSDPRLYREYRGAGLQRPRSSATAKSYFGLVGRLPLLGAPHAARALVCAGRKALGPSRRVGPRTHDAALVPCRDLPEHPGELLELVVEPLLGHPRHRRS